MLKLANKGLFSLLFESSDDNKLAVPMFLTTGRLKRSWGRALPYPLQDRFSGFGVQQVTGGQNHAGATAFAHVVAGLGVAVRQEGLLCRKAISSGSGSPSISTAVSTTRAVVAGMVTPYPKRSWRLGITPSPVESL